MFCFIRKNKIGRNDNLNIFKNKDEVIEILENNNIEYNEITTLSNDNRALYNCISIYYNNDNSLMEAGTIMKREKYLKKMKDEIINKMNGRITVFYSGKIVFEDSTNFIINNNNINIDGIVIPMHNIISYENKKRTDNCISHPFNLIIHVIRWV